MSKRKNGNGGSDDDVVDLARVREEIEAVRREALAYGYTLDTDRPLQELRLALGRIRKERDGKPACFGRSYLDAAPHCRVCDLARPCAEPADPAAYLPPSELMAVTCELCETGTLNVELVEPATGNVRDYGCSTEGCTHTLLQQQRFVPAPRKGDAKPGLPPPDYKNAPKPSRWTINEIEDGILKVTRDREVVRFKRDFRALLPVSMPRLSRQIDTLVKEKRLKHRKGKGFFLPVN